MQEFKEYQKVRGDLYIFLSNVFYKEPNIDYLDGLKKRLPILVAISDTSKESNLKTGVQMMSDFLNGLNEANMTQTTDSLSCEFTSLFLGIQTAFAGHTIFTSESPYLSVKKFAMQEQRDEVMKIYHKHQIKVKDNFKEPEDHITMEMNFLGALSQKIYESIENNNEEEAEELLKEQLSFLNNHLNLFVNKITLDMEKYASSDYYKSIAKIISGFVCADTTLLKEIIE